MSDIADLALKAEEVRIAYSELNQKNGHDSWGPKEYAMGFAGDFGDLMKLVMAKENLRHIDDVDQKLAHELADCLWSVLVIAKKYNIDIEAEFMKNMDILKTRIAEAA